MTDQELRKMNRKELLELLVASEKENERLKERIQQQELQFQNRELKLKNAGNIAEAALALNEVFECADKAAAQYLENIKRCSEDQESIYNRIVSEAEQKAKAILDSARREAKKEKKRLMNIEKTFAPCLECFIRATWGLYSFFRFD